MNIKELKKEKLTIRKTNPFRSQVYGNILDGAGKVAKLENRDITENDIISSCKKGIKNLTSTIELVGKGGVVDAYRKEVEILKEFLPAQIDETEIIAFIEGEIATLENKRTISGISKELKIVCIISQITHEVTLPTMINR